MITIRILSHEMFKSAHFSKPEHATRQDGNNQQSIGVFISLIIIIKIAYVKTTRIISNIFRCTYINIYYVTDRRRLNDMFNNKNESKPTTSFPLIDSITSDETLRGALVFRNSQFLSH